MEFAYNQISSWAATKTNFAFVTGDLKDQKKYVFKTDQVEFHGPTSSLVLSHLCLLQGKELSDLMRNNVNVVYAAMLNK